MFRANDSGIFMSTTQPDEAYYLSGVDVVAEGGFTLRNRTPVAAIRGSAVTIDRASLPAAERTTGSPVIFATTDGFHAGLSDGAIVAITPGMYKVRDSMMASAMYVPDGDASKVLLSLSDRPTSSRFRIRMPAITTNITGRVS
jgi:hypothetical protein